MSSPEDFTVGWICAIPTEQVAARAMLEEELPQINRARRQDQNNYVLGRIGQHRVTITVLPDTFYGISSATAILKDMTFTFPNIQFVLMVGIGGGAPTVDRPIRLGDVVVSRASDGNSGVLQYDFGKTVQTMGFQKTGFLSPPSIVLGSAISSLMQKHEYEGHRIQQNIALALEKNPRLNQKYAQPPIETDRLFKSTALHPQNSEKACADVCDNLDVVLREQRAAGVDPPRIYYGIIASANNLMKDAILRDKLAEEEKVLCFEMEAAGLMNHFPCLVIRGICDYSDTHKSKDWQGYASMTAAAYAKELLHIIPSGPANLSRSDPHNVQSSRPFTIPFNASSFPLIQSFIGRDSELNDIEQAFAIRQANDLPSRLVLSLYGPGGIGKTQIAARFAQANKSRFSAIVWLNGTTADSLKESLVNFSSQIEPVKGGKLAENGQSVDETAHGVLMWLARPENTEWLIIFDNVDLDIDAKIPDPQAYNVQDFFPAADHGCILITSRLESMQRLGRGNKIDRFSPAESMRLIEVQLNRSVSGDIAVQAMIEHLDGLPLALSMATSYIRETGMSLQEYNQHYNNAWSELVKQQDDYPLRQYGHRAMLATWHLSFDQIKNQDMDTAQLLILFSLFNNAGLNYDIFEIAAHAAVLDGLDASWLGRICKSKLSFTRSIRLLLRYSLIERAKPGEDLSIHTVIHEWAFHLAHQEQENVLEQFYAVAARIIARQTPQDHQTAGYWPVRKRLVPHANMLSRRISIAEPAVDLEMGDLLILGDVLNSYGGSSYAAVPFLRALMSSEELLGPTHQSTLQICNYLGTVYSRGGKLEKAEQMYLRALEGIRSTLGSDHPSAHDILNNLGLLYRDQGKFDRAEQMFNMALHSDEEAPRSDRELTLNVVMNLGLLFIDQGKLDEAEETLLQALQDCETALGLEHRLTLDAVSYLAGVYCDRRKLRQAEQMYVRALQSKERILGLDHESTLETLNNVGSLYNLQGKFNEAEQTFVRAVQGFKDKMGPGHKATIKAVVNLGTLYLETERFEQAEQVFMRAFQECGDKLGLDHESTLEVANYLGITCDRQNDLVRSRQMFETALQGYEKLLGPDHITTLGVVKSLGTLYSREDNPSVAERMYIRALWGYYNEFGPYHNLTQGIAHCLGFLYRQLSSDNFGYDTSQMIGRILKFIKYYNQYFITMLGHLGKALFTCKEFDEGTEAFFLQYLSTDSLWTNAVCCGCQVSGDPDQRFVCKECFDVDLCLTCYERYDLGATGSSGCRGHEFVELSFNSHAGASDDLQELTDAFLQRLTKRYIKD